MRVLIVDDSAFMRKVLQSIIATDPQLEIVGEARDGREAIAMNESLRPDVITMDIMMPHVDGLQATEQIMATNPRPIIIVSSEAREGADATLRALELGAIDFVPKPSSGIDLDMNSIRDEICRKLKMASRVRVVRNARNLARRSLAAPCLATHTPTNLAHRTATGTAMVTEQARTQRRQLHGQLARVIRLVIMAASTGGPQTLMQLVPAISTRLHRIHRSSAAHAGNIHGAVQQATR